jgi:ABC-type molybdate transport system substrate-binding protein
VQDYEASTAGTTVRFVFGASGLLRERLQGGERADLFASANMEHPQALAASGRAGPAVRFTRNRLCAIAAPRFDLQGQTLVDRLLDPAIKVGTSTPQADPSGDYALAMFDRIEASGAAPTCSLPTAPTPRSGAAKSPRCRCWRFRTRSTWRPTTGSS